VPRMLRWGRSRWCFERSAHSASASSRTWLGLEGVPHVGRRHAVARSDSARSRNGSSCFPSSFSSDSLPRVRARSYTSPSAPAAPSDSGRRPSRQPAPAGARGVQRVEHHRQNVPPDVRPPPAAAASPAGRRRAMRAEHPPSAAR
jgi:hypothetical protein